MGKGIAKYGMKSGILPRVRPIFKNPIKAQPVDPELVKNTGYAEGVQEPKRVRRVQLEKKVVSVDELKAVQLKPSPLSLKDELTPEQKWKLKRSEMRKEYLERSYDLEVKKLEKEERKQEYLNEKKAEEDRIRAQHTESAATTLTLPTITELLKGPIIQPRTEAQKKENALKKRYNREKIVYEADFNRASKLLELYHDSANFIITEEELLTRVEQVFSAERQDEYTKKSQLISHKLLPIGIGISRSTQKEAFIADTIFGTVATGKPGVPTVQQELSGERSSIVQEAELALLAQRKMVEQQLRTEAQEQQAVQGSQTSDLTLDDLVNGDKK